MRLAETALKTGMCVVIGLQSTGEARTTARVESDGFDGEFVSSLREIPASLMEKFFYGGTELGVDLPAIPALDSLRGTIDEMLDMLDPPVNALDDLIDKLGGPDRVAEMTGRGARIVRRRGTLVYEKRVGDTSVEAVNISERRRFQAGEKLIGIISDAASTGVSLQADRRVVNQRALENRGVTKNYQKLTLTVPLFKVAACTLRWSCRGVPRRRCSSWAARTAPTSRRLPSTACSRPASLASGASPRPSVRTGGTVFVSNQQKHTSFLT